MATAPQPCGRLDLALRGSVLRCDSGVCDGSGVGVVTKKQVWRYFCGYCKKTGLSAGHMARHEKHCTGNLDRICRMHKYFAEKQPSIVALMATINTRLPDCGMSELRRMATNCPMCILSAIRQSGILKFSGDSEDAPPPDLKFDFKDELKAAWDLINETAAENSLSRE